MAQKKIIERKFHYFYKTTNLINDCFYYGIHSTDNLDDSYIGSGKILKQAIKKYGRLNFKKEIIKTFLTRQEVIDYERLIITHELIENENCYNLQVGGSMIEIKIVTEETREKQSLSKKKNPPMLGKFGELHPFYGKKHSEETKLQIKKSVGYGENNKNFGSVRSPETRELIGSIRRGKPGKKHSETTKERMRENNHENKKCIIDGLIFQSMAEAGRFFNFRANKVSYRIKSDKYPTWQLYVEDSVN